MKTIFLGDTHGRTTWKDIIAKENPDRVVFIGDYFDSFDIGGAEQMHNFKEIIEYKETSFTNDGQDDQHKTEVILLIGNHDYHYYPGNETYSGYQHGAAPAIRQLLEENKDHLQMCYQLDNILCTHAGVGHNWLVEQERYESGSIADFINDLWNYKPNQFMFCGFNPYGDSKTQTPIWIRPLSLMSGNKETFLKTDYIQIVGHTGVKKIDIEGKATGGRYYFIDAIDIGQYLIYEGGTFKLGQL
jgi:predicted phosphodiesterase